MARTRMLVCYFGEQWDGQELADLAEMNFSTFFRRWERIGKPADITPFGSLLSPIRTVVAGAYILIAHDGYSERIPVARAIVMFGISDGCLRDRIAKYGRTLTIEQLQVDKQRQAAGSKSKGTVAYKNTRAAKVVITDSGGNEQAPGWWEREHLSNTGQSGFCKSSVDNFSGTNSAGFPVYTGVGR